MTDDAQSLAEQCGTSVHATELEALLCNLQEQKIKQAMASSYIAPGALEGKYSQVYDLDRKDQMYIREDGSNCMNGMNQLLYSNSTSCYGATHRQAESFLKNYEVFYSSNFEVQ